MHELVNVNRMMELLIDENFFVYPDKANGVIKAMMQFRDDYSKKFKNQPIINHKKCFIDPFAGELIDEWSDKVKLQAGIK